MRLTQPDFMRSGARPSLRGRVPVVLSILVCLASLTAFMQATSDYDQAQEQLQDAKARLKRMLRETSTNDSDTKSKAAQQALEKLSMASWDSILMALEQSSKEVRSGVSLLAMTSTPSPVASLERMLITGLALNQETLLNYLQALRTHPSALAVELINQQVDEKKDAGFVRFQLQIDWNPTQQVPTPVLPGWAR